ncbi:glycosyltransferase family 4 protein [Enterococcus faecium]|uniref:glycosyltransferase n=1 Tax=Enterococcus TaxID=1350 RepID=UPI0009BF61EC|nr:glycosyltransferase [Enterococcus faecium]MBX4243237.1 glycosyltransferase [Enterococcus lactis]EGP4970767.1 glycosyltransferase family 4 protein [Enterococcus faecium]EGP5554234.1 glycosyltransferase [Enterococcus faecium]MBX4247729.1 glycosyltransferase [Enterococcus lactis]MCH6118114.1 glycosyltransferase [Enterococcus faecium]
MRIVVNDIAASKGGAMSVLQNFYQEIIEKDDDNEWIFLLGDKYLENTTNIRIKTFPEIKKSWIKRLFFDLVLGKTIINELHPDIYLSLQNTATLGVNCKQFVFLHQVLPFQKEQSFSFFKRNQRRYAVYQKIIGKVIKFSIKKSKANVIVQTKWLKSVLDSFFPDNIIKVVPPTVEGLTNCAERRKQDKVSNTFFYPAANLIYKNHKLIFEAVDILIERGYRNFRVVLTIDKPDISPNNSDSYLFLGMIDKKLVCHYYETSVLLFPSYIESYGLPLKEATQFGSTIFSSDTGVSREVLGKYSNAFFFNAFNSNELANLMEMQLTNTLTLNNKNVEDIADNSGLLMSDLILKNLDE